MQVHALRKYLEGYDINEVTFLMDGFSRGFSVYCEKVAVNQNCNNLRSTVEHKDIVFEKICKELLAHRFAGPFLMPPFTNFNNSPLGLCPKKEPNKFRLIHHTLQEILLMILSQTNSLQFGIRKFLMLLQVL